jgi:hypothetical protein
VQSQTSEMQQDKTDVQLLPNKTCRMRLPRHTGERRRPLRQLVWGTHLVCRCVAHGVNDKPGPKQRQKYCIRVRDHAAGTWSISGQGMSRIPPSPTSLTMYA